jgi:hypothetical protein
MPGSVPGMRPVRGVPAGVRVVPAAGVLPRRTVSSAVPSRVVALIVRVMGAAVAGIMPPWFAVIAGDLRGMAPSGIGGNIFPAVLMALVQPAPQLVEALLGVLAGIILIVLLFILVLGLGRQYHLAGRLAVPAP